MDTLQAFLTTAATVVEYFFFSYLALALLFHAFQMQALEPSPKGLGRMQSRSVRFSHNAATNVSGLRSSVSTTTPTPQPATLIPAG